MDWYTAADWEPLGVPSPGDDVIISSGAPFLQSGDPEITVHSITINRPARASDPGRTQLVTGNFTNAGTLDIDVFSGEGGSNLTIAGTLANAGTAPGTAQVDSTSLNAATTVTLGGLVNPTGRELRAGRLVSHRALFSIN